MTLISSYSNIPAVVIGQPMTTIIDTLNENSEQTNEIREVLEQTEVYVSNIGNTTTIPNGRTVVEQLEWLTERLANLMDSRGLLLEFLASPPTYTSSEVPSPFYFDTTHQTLMVWHEGDQLYYPAYGCNSITDPLTAIAPVWEYAGIIVPPPAPTGCLPLPAGCQAGVAQAILTLPAMSMTSAAVFSSNIFSLSIEGGVTKLYKTDILTGVTMIVATYAGKIIKPMMLVNANGTLVYTIGGQTELGGFSSKIFKFDIVAGTVVQLTNSPTSFRSGSVSYDQARSKAFLFGGETLIGGYSQGLLNTIHEFDFTTELLTVHATHLPIAMTGVASTSQPDLNGLIYIAGGRSGSTMMVNSLSSEILSFNPATGVLTEIGNLNTRRGYGRLYCGTSGDLFYVGGYSDIQGNCVTQTALNEHMLVMNMGTGIMQLPGISGAPVGFTEVFGIEEKDCGYAVHVVNRGNTRDEVFLIKI